MVCLSLLFIELRLIDMAQQDFGQGSTARNRRRAERGGARFDSSIGQERESRC